MTPDRILAILHSLGRGDLETVRARLAEARQGCLDLGRPELAALLEEAAAALQGGDIRTWRRRVETAIARLGHLR